MGFFSGERIVHDSSCRGTCWGYKPPPPRLTPLGPVVGSHWMSRAPHGVPSHVGHLGLAVSVCASEHSVMHIVVADRALSPHVVSERVSLVYATYTTCCTPITCHEWMVPFRKGELPEPCAQFRDLYLVIDWRGCGACCQGRQLAHHRSTLRKVPGSQLLHWRSVLCLILLQILLLCLQNHPLSVAAAHQYPHFGKLGSNFRCSGRCPPALFGH